MTAERGTRAWMMEEYGRVLQALSERYGREHNNHQITGQTMSAAGYTFECSCGAFLHLPAMVDDVEGR